MKASASSPGLLRDFRSRSLERLQYIIRRLLIQEKNDDGDAMKQLTDFFVNPENRKVLATSARHLYERLCKTERCNGTLLPIATVKATTAILNGKQLHVSRENVLNLLEVSIGYLDDSQFQVHVVEELQALLKTKRMNVEFEKFMHAMILRLLTLRGHDHAMHSRMMFSRMSNLLDTSSLQKVEIATWVSRAKKHLSDSQQLRKQVERLEALQRSQAKQLEHVKRERDALREASNDLIEQAVELQQCISQCELREEELLFELESERHLSSRKSSSDRTTEDEDETEKDKRKEVQDAKSPGSINRLLLLNMKRPVDSFQLF